MLLIARATSRAERAAAQSSPRAVTPAETMAEANRLMLESSTSPDFAVGVQSFVERRSPRFAQVSDQAAGAGRR